MNKSLLILFMLMIVKLSQQKEDYYKLLGVGRNADENELKRAFKKLSLKYHPDKNKKNPEQAKEHYAKIVNAYEVLKDPKTRQAYDRGGEKGVNDFQQQQNSGGGGFNGFHNFDDIFRNFGGGGGHYQKPKTVLFADCDVFNIEMSTLSRFYRRNQVWIILFYSPEEKSSQVLKDTWRSLASKFYGIFNVAAVNCEDEEEICGEEFGVRNYPTVEVFAADSNAESVRYTGDMELNKLANFAVKHMESFVQYVSEDNYKDFVNFQVTLNKVILFTNKKTTPPLLKALSKDLKGKLIFGEVRSDNSPLIQKFKLQSLPTLLVVTDAYNYQGTFYDGEFKKDQIMKFLREYAYGEKKKIEKSGEAMELTHDRIQAGSCGKNDANLCFLMIINTSQNSQIINNQIQIINQLASNYKDKSINFFISANDQLRKDVFGEDSSGVYILKSKKSKYTSYNSQINFENLQEFVENVLNGDANYVQLNMSIEEAFNNSRKSDL